MYNLIEYSDNYSKTCVSLYQYYKDEHNNNVADSESWDGLEIVLLLILLEKENLQ